MQARDSRNVPGPIARPRGEDCLCCGRWERPCLCDAIDAAFGVKAWEVVIPGDKVECDHDYLPDLTDGNLSRGCMTCGQVENPVGVANVEAA